MTIEELNQQIQALKAERTQAIIRYGIIEGKIEMLEMWRDTLATEAKIAAEQAQQVEEVKANGKEPVAKG